MSGEGGVRNWCCALTTTKKKQCVNDKQKERTLYISSPDVYGKKKTTYCNDLLTFSKWKDFV